MTENAKPCIRCLVADIPGGEALARIVRERIGQIPENRRCPEPDYSARLAVCRGCDSLRSGTCALCGCYAEIRAAKTDMDCPDVPSKWTKR